MGFELGQRIAIIGPSSSGKSTLARRIGDRLNHPVLHLDQIAHKPGTAWERLLDSELIAAQNEFITAHDHWIIEGNYKVCMARRMRLAETVIWCDPPLAGCLWRYAMRCLYEKDDRPGGLAGAKKEFNLALVLYTLRNYPKNKRIYERLIEDNPHLTVIRLKRFKDVKVFGEAI